MICVCRARHLSGCGTWEARKHTPWQTTRKGQALVENTGTSCDTNSDIQTSDKHTCYPVGTPWSYRALHHASKSASMAPAWGEKNRVPNLSGPGFHISTGKQMQRIQRASHLGTQGLKHACKGTRTLSRTELIHWRITKHAQQTHEMQLSDIEHGSCYLMSKSATRHAACNSFQKRPRKRQGLLVLSIFQAALFVNRLRRRRLLIARILGESQTCATFQCSSLLRLTIVS